MVEFLKTIKGKDFSYEQGKRYVSSHSYTEANLKDKVFVRQPNSPKKKNWWTEFPKSSKGEVFKILPEDEMDFFEKREEDRLLQLH